MPTIVTKEEFQEELRRDAEKRARDLADAKAAAAGLGKERFDLEKLETMCDTSQQGRVDPIEERRARYEYMYYVEWPSLVTLRELAELITRSAW